MEVAKKRIVVIGAGFGGLRAALSLDSGLKKHNLGESHRVTLVDRDNYHIYTPLLYKFATNPDFPDAEVVYPLAEILKGTNIDFRQGSADKADFKNATIELANGETIHYDYLVLDPGSEINYFDIPGLKENSLPLKNFEDAKNLRSVLAALPSNARVVIGGGGASGVETAAEIKLRYGFEVTIVEAMPGLLNGMRPALAEVADKRLREVGVKVLTDSPIMAVDQKELSLKSSEKIPFDLLIWTGGIKIPTWIPALPLKSEKHGKLEVLQDMECSARDTDFSLAARVYAMGDAVCVLDENGAPLPASARVAIEEAKIVAQNILNRILERPAVKYQPLHYPYALPIGGNYAAAMIGSMILKGFPAHIFEELIEINYRLSIGHFDIVGIRL